MAKDKSKSGRKIGRNKRHQAGAYKAGMRFERNRKRRWRRVLREQPGNLQLRKQYDKVIGTYEGEPSARARRKAAKPRVRKTIKVIEPSASPATTLSLLV